MSQNPRLLSTVTGKSKDKPQEILDVLKHKDRVVVFKVFCLYLF